jgi:hypothetical protein
LDVTATATGVDIGVEWHVTWFPSWFQCRRKRIVGGMWDRVGAGYLVLDQDVRWKIAE